MFVIFFVFFFKQKTAYEMRISDWSSDVCSSDLCRPPDRRARLQTRRQPAMYPIVRASISYRRTVRPCSGLASIACLDYLFSLIHRACLIAVVLDLRGADDMFVVSDIEQSHARRLADRKSTRLNSSH